MSQLGWNQTVRWIHKLHVSYGTVFLKLLRLTTDTVALPPYLSSDLLPAVNSQNTNLVSTFRTRMYNRDHSNSCNRRPGPTSRIRRRTANSQYILCDLSTSFTIPCENVYR